MLDILYVVDNGEEMLEKKCNKCNEVLPVSNFFRNKNCKDGFRPACKVCESPKYKEYRANHKVEIREYFLANKEQINKTERERNKVKSLNRVPKIRAKKYKTEEEILQLKEYKKAWRRKYYKTNYYKFLERNKAYQKITRSRTSEKIRAYVKEYGKTHRAEARERARKSRLNNPGLGVAYNSRRRAKKLGNGGFHTPGEIQYLKELQNFKCLMCNKCEPEIKLTIDHILPVSKGGGDGLGNLQMLCRSCNSSKNAKFIDFRGIKPKRIKA